MESEVSWLSAAGAVAGEREGKDEGAEEFHAARCERV